MVDGVADDPWLLPVLADDDDPQVVEVDAVLDLHAYIPQVSHPAPDPLLIRRPGAHADGFLDGPELPPDEVDAGGEPLPLLVALIEKVEELHGNVHQTQGGLHLQLSLILICFSLFSFARSVDSVAKLSCVVSRDPGDEDMPLAIAVPFVCFGRRRRKKILFTPHLP